LSENASNNEADYLPTLRVIFAELDRVTLGHRTRFDSLQSKAALLVTGSAVLAGIALDAAGVTALLTTSFAGAAAALGVTVMWPKPKDEISPTKLRNSFLGGQEGPKSETEALLELYDTRASLNSGDEDRLERVSKILKAGFASLGLAILPLALQAVATTGALDWYLNLLENAR